MSMKYVVLVKGVPDFSEGDIEFNEDNTLDRGSTGTTLNPNDHFALEAALEAKVKHGGEVHVLCMGPPNYDQILEEAMEIYADELRLLSSRHFAAADTLATAEALSKGIETVGDVDVVFAGFKSADGETGQTGPQTAWKLDLPIITHATDVTLHPDEDRLEVERLTEDAVETLEGPLPAMVVTDPEFEPSYDKASHRLRLRELREATAQRVEEAEEHLETWDHEDIGADVEKVGLNGSPTIVSGVDPIPQAPQERDADVLDADDPEDMEELAEVVIEKAEL